MRPVGSSLSHIWRRFFQGNSAEIEFKFNPLFASHCESVFKRQIESIRKILEVILAEFGHSLNPDSFPLGAQLDWKYTLSKVIKTKSIS